MSRLGDTLQERRRALGLSIEQAEEATKIRVKLLRAIEHGEYDRLPNPGYVRGYISSYARFLELDPLPLLAIYKAESGTMRRPDLDLPHVEEAVPRTGEQHAVPFRVAVILVIVLVAISVAVWFAIRLASGPATLAPEPVPPQRSTAPSSAIAGSETSDPKPRTGEVSQAAPFTLDVSVDAAGASWLQISVDGRQAYVGTLTGGQSKRFEVTAEASVRIGKPAVVTILRDGKKVALPKGEAPVLTLTAEPPE